MGKRSLDKPLPSIFRWWKKERRRRRDWGLWVDNEVVQEGIQLLFVLLEKIRAATKQLLSRRKSRSRSGLFCRVCTTIYLQTKSMKLNSNSLWWQQCSTKIPPKCLNSTKSPHKKWGILIFYPFLTFMIRHVRWRLCSFIEISSQINKFFHQNYCSNGFYEFRSWNDWNHRLRPWNMFREIFYDI